jgi:hypothetical protein
MVEFAIFTLSVVPTAGEVLIASYATRDGSAKAGVDYVASQGSVTFEIGDAAKTVNVEIIPTTKGGDFYLDVDWIDPLGNTVNRYTGMACLEYEFDPNSGGGGGGGGGGGDPGDGAPIPPGSVFFLSVSDGSIPTPGVGRFTISTYPASGSSLAISYETRNATAIAGVDYTPVSGQKIFSPGQVSDTFDVPILIGNSGKSFLADVGWVSAPNLNIVSRKTGILTVPYGPPPEPEPEPPGTSRRYYASIAEHNTANVTVVLPSGSPGDLLIVTFAGGYAGGNFSPPAGWTMQHQYIEHEHMAVAFKTRGVSEPNPTFTRSAAQNVVVFCYNIQTVGYPVPTQLDDSNHQSITTSQASYICAGITMAVPHNLLVFMTCARQWDNVLETINTGPDSSSGMVFSPGILSAGPNTLGVFTHNQWAQTGGAYNTGIPFNHRCYMGWWGGSGPTGQVAYPCPAGNTRSTSFLLGFRVPG